LLIVCGTACFLGVVVADAVLMYHLGADAVASVGEKDFVKRWALAGGGLMVSVGVFLGIVGALSGPSGTASGQRPQTFRASMVAWAVARWLLGAVGGAIIGGIAGAGIGGSLALNVSDQVRTVGSTLVGAFAGAALGRRRAWLVVIGCAMTGYFVGAEIGKHSLSLAAVGIPVDLDGQQVALIGFAIIGAVVGSVLGADRREPSALKKAPEPEAKPAVNSTAPAKEIVPAEKTVRRPVGRS
jgi:hypothetical protein